MTGSGKLPIMSRARVCPVRSVDLHNGAGRWDVSNEARGDVCLRLWVSTPHPGLSARFPPPLLSSHSFVCLPSRQWTVKSDWFHRCILHMHEPAARSTGMDTRSPVGDPRCPLRKHARTTQTPVCMCLHAHTVIRINLVIHTYTCIFRGFHKYVKWGMF